MGGGVGSSRRSVGQGPQACRADSRSAVASAGQPADIRLAARQKHSKAKVEAFRVWAEAQLPRIPGKGDLARAFRYGLSRWPAFCLFLEDGRVAMDNNAAERALRPIGIGRKNWLFAGADTGAETLARAMTIIETCLCRARHNAVHEVPIMRRSTV